MFGRSRKKCKEWRNNSDENDRIRSFDGRCRVDGECVAGGHQEGAGCIQAHAVREAITRQADGFKAITREAITWQAGCIQARIGCEADTWKADCIKAHAGREAGAH